MVAKLLQIAISALAFFGATTTAQPVGQYFRPSGNEVSAVQGSNAKYLRCPCPALNTLANHGHLPRNGRDITPDMLRKAVMGVFNVDFFTAQLQTSGLANRMTLADLSKHNQIEHDASLVHADEFYRQDPAKVDGGLTNELLARAVNGRLGKRELGDALRARLIWCQQKQGGCSFGTDQRDITFREAALLLEVFGSRNGTSVSVDHAFSFLVDEQIPDDWRKPNQAVTLNELENISREIQRIAGL